MPNTKKSPVLRMAQFMSEMGPEVKETVMAILNKQEGHPAVAAVQYFAGLKVNVARAVLAIVVSDVNERDDNYKKPGRPKASKPQATSVVEEGGGQAAAQPSGQASPVAQPAARAATGANPGGKARR